MHSSKVSPYISNAWANTGLRTKLEIFILMALLPLISLVIIMLLQQRQQEIDNARHQTFLLAERGAKQQTDTIQQAYGALQMLGLAPDIRRGNADQCASVLQQAMKLHPWSVGFAVANSNGKILCNTGKDIRGSSISNRDYFKKSLTTKEFSVSGFIVGQNSGKALIAMALPILDEHGDIEIFLLAGIELEWLADLLKDVAQASGGVVTLFDSKGTILARAPDSGGIVGQSMAHHPTVQEILKGASGVLEAPGLDDVPRIIGYASLQGVGGRITIGVKRDSVVADVNRKLLWSTGVMAAVVLVIVTGIWFLMEILVLRGLRSLQETTLDLSMGKVDMRSPRAPAHSQSTEIGDVARAVHSMGKTLGAIAFQDPLTGLANRRFLDAHMERLSETPPTLGDAVALLCIDLDGFKPVNDRHGHHVGDAVLQEIGLRLTRCIRDGDVAARLGGDEFVIFLSAPNSARNDLSSEIAHRIIQTIAMPIPVEGISLTVGCSIGIACWPTDDSDLGTVLRYADQALYAAKNSGRRRAIRYEPTPQKQAERA